MANKNEFTGMIRAIMPVVFSINTKMPSGYATNFAATRKKPFPHVPSKDFGFF
jgi:hypothetical protein